LKTPSFAKIVSLGSVNVVSSISNGIRQLCKPRRSLLGL
jgi:hypothetical protein